MVVPQGWASAELPDSKERPEGASLAPLLDAITQLVPPPSGALDAEAKVRHHAHCCIDGQQHVRRPQASRVSARCWLSETQGCSIMHCWRANTEYCISRSQAQLLMHSLLAVDPVEACNLPSCRCW